MRQSGQCPWTEPSLLLPEAQRPGFTVTKGRAEGTLRLCGLTDWHGAVLAASDSGYSTLSR